MRSFLVRACLGAFTALTLPLAVHAADINQTACPLLTAKDMASVGFEMTGRPRGNTFNVTPEQSGAPSDISAEICFYYSGIEGGRHSISVTVETFTNTKGIAEWLAGKNAKTSSEGATLTRVGESTCESGRYQFASANGNDRGDKYEQRYMSCDHFDGHRHVIVGVDIPATEGKLPEATDVNRLLGAVVNRLQARAQ